MVPGQGACMTLIKFSLSQRLRLAGLVWASPQENVWVWLSTSSLGSKYLGALAPSGGSVFMMGVGMENNTCQFPHFQRSPSTCSKINMMRSVSCCPLCCVNCHFHVASAQNAVCLRAFTLSLDLLAHSVLSPLTFKAPGSKCQQFYKLTEFRPSSSQSQTV